MRKNPATPRSLKMSAVVMLLQLSCMFSTNAVAAPTKIEDKTGVTQGNVEWIKRLTVSQDTKILVSPMGDVFVLANIVQEDNPIARDWLIRKFDADGKLQWQQRVGSLQDDYVVAAAVDQKDNLYVLGTTMGAFARSQHAGGGDLALVKFKADGSRVWAKQYGAQGPEEAKGIALDRSGIPYIVFDAKSPDGSPVISVLQFSRSGDQGWVRQFDSGLDDIAVDIVMGQRGLLYVLGQTDGNMWGHHNRGLSDVVVFKLSLEGETIWVDQLGDKAADTPQRLVTDRFGNVRVLVTEVRGELAAQGIGTADIKLYSLFAGDGRLNWMRRITAFGQNGGIEAVDMASNNWGQTFVLAWTAAPMEKTKALGGMDNLLLHYTADGDLIWMKRLGGPGADRPQSIAVANDDRSIYLSGTTTGSFAGYATSTGKPVAILTRLK